MTADCDRLPGIFAALANADRLALLRAVSESQVRAGMEGRNRSSIAELAEATGMTRFAASRHLAILASAGLVTPVRMRQRVVHHINMDSIESVEDWLYTYPEVSVARD